MWRTPSAINTSDECILLFKIIWDLKSCIFLVDSRIRSVYVGLAEWSYNYMRWHGLWSNWANLVMIWKKVFRIAGRIRRNLKMNYWTGGSWWATMWIREGHSNIFRPNFFERVDLMFGYRNCLSLWWHESMRKNATAPQPRVLLRSIAKREVFRN